MSGLSGRSFVSICNRWRVEFGLDVTERDGVEPSTCLSRSVTVRTDFGCQMLQIEMNSDGRFGLSRSVTDRVVLAE